MNLFIGNRISFIKPFYENKTGEILVLTKKNSRLDVYAYEMNLETKYYTDRSTFLRILENLDYDTLYSAGCPYLIPINLLYDTNKIFINVHPSLLPNYPGIHSITESMYNEGPYGVTIHTMGAIADSGRLISQKEFSVPRHMSAEETFELFFREEEKLILATLVEGKFKDIKHNYESFEKIQTEPINFRRDVIFREIVPTMSIKEIEKRVKILNVKNHHAFLDLNGEKIYVTSVLSRDILESRNVNNNLVQFQAIDGLINLQVLY
jgi:methionyl-tRNA formyltransferase